MALRFHTRRRNWLLHVQIGLLALAAGPSLTAQERNEKATTAVKKPPTPDNAGREARLEERIRQLESIIQKMPDPERVRRLEQRLEQMPDRQYVHELEAKVQKLSTQVKQASLSVQGPASVGPGSPTSLPSSNALDDLPDALPGLTDGVDPGLGASDEPVGGAAGLSAAAPPPSPRFEMPEPIPNIPLFSRFGPGFEFKTEDDEFNLQFHNLTEADGRFYGNGKQSPVADTFGLARQWLVFSGHMTKPIEYYISVADAFDTFNILDVFLNVNFDKRLQFRIGRYKSPFTYEFYAEPTQALPNGEWSLFFNNFGMNRDAGAMLWGQVADDRFDYAVGLFNSVPNGYVDASNPKDGIAFLNFAPFETRPGSILENFNIGASTVFGDQDHTPVPQTMRTIVPTGGSTVLGVPFLEFNDNVVAKGQRELGSLHTAYFYQQFWAIAEWQGGFQSFARTDHAASVRVPVESFYVQAGYFLTGERIASRGQLNPFHPFDLRKGKFGIGGWEVAGRFSLLDIGDQVFTNGFANSNDWTNKLYATDLTLNWYWNQYMRVMFDWQHAGFNTPVHYASGGFQKSSDLFIIRFQMWF